MNLTMLGLFAGIFFVLGILAALAVVSLRAEWRKPSPDDKALPDPLNGLATDAATGKIPERKEIAHLWQEESSGRMLVELDGKVYGSVAGLSPEQRQRLSQSAGAIQSWLEQDQSAHPSPPPAREAERLVPRPGLETLSSALPASQEQAPPTRPRLGMLEVFLRSVQGGTSRPKSEPKSIVAQIDEILQADLAGTPLAGRGIRLQERLDHSLEVVVGLERYAGIEAVPDEEVRSLIRRAVSEWERQSSQK